MKGQNGNQGLSSLVFKKKLETSLACLGRPGLAAPVLLVAENAGVEPRCFLRR